MARLVDLTKKLDKLDKNRYYYDYTHALHHSPQITINQYNVGGWIEVEIRDNMFHVRTCPFELLFKDSSSVIDFIQSNF